MRPFTILIADDDDDDAELLTEALHKTFLEVVIERVTDGYYFLKKLKDKTFHADLIFLDLNMPLRRGIDCLNEIKSRPDYSTIPVIVYSTSQYIKDIDACYKAGAQYYLLKPESFQSLQNLVKILYEYFTNFNTNNNTTIPKDKFVLRDVNQGMHKYTL